MRFENLITLTAGFVLFGGVSCDLCAQSKELRKSRTNQTNNTSVQQEIYQKYNNDVVEELRNCDEGYAERFCNENEFVCEPVCRAGCKNGTCTAPGKCVCADGYELRVNENAECVQLTMDTDMWHIKGLALTQEQNKKLDICRSQCTCWRESSQGGCLKLCDPNATDTDCLKEESSVCDTSDYSIVYTKDATQKNYTCDYQKQISNSNKYSKGQLWILIGGSIFIGIMLIAIVYLCVRIYQTRHETGAHDIPISLLMKF